MAYRRNHGFFFYGFWVAVIVLAFIGSSSLYHNFDNTSKAVTKTAKATSEVTGEGLDKIIEAIDKAKE